MAQNVPYTHGPLTVNGIRPVHEPGQEMQGWCLSCERELAAYLMRNPRHLRRLRAQTDLAIAREALLDVLDRAFEPLATALGHVIGWLESIPRRLRWW